MNAHPRRVLPLVLALLLLAPAGVLATGHRYVESFASTRYRDSLRTTALWDTKAGELKLPPFSMSYVGSYNTPGNARGIAVAGDYAYVCDYSSGLEILNIQNPSNPTLLGSYDTPGYAKAVAVAERYAYVADYATGLVVLNIANPASPTLAGTYDTPGSARAVALAGDVAYVADYSNGVVSVNITNPAAPTLLGRYDTPGTAVDVAVAGDRLYVADGSDGLLVLGISTPSAPTLLGSYDTPGSAGAVAVAGDRAYVADGGDGVLVLDITNPASPTLLGTCKTPGNANGVAVDGNNVYVMDADVGLLRFDVGNPSAPTLADSIGTPATAYAVAVDGDRAYVADDVWGMQVVKVAEPDSLALMGSLKLNYPDHLSITIAGDHAYVASHYGGLNVIDIHDPSHLELAGNIDTTYSLRRVAVAGDYAYVAATDAGLFVVNIADPAHPAVVGSYNTPGFAYGVAVDGDYAYVADRLGGVKVLDIHTPASPAFADSFHTTYEAYDLFVDGNYLYVLELNGRLQVLDISNPTNVTSVALITVSQYVYDVAFAGRYAFVLGYPAGVITMDISNPASPVFADTCWVPGGANGVCFMGNRLYVACGTPGRLEVIDAANPTALARVGNIGTPGVANDVAAAGDHAFVVDYDSVGVLAFRVQQRVLAPDLNQGRSLVVNDVPADLVKTRLSTAQTGLVSWELSADNGAHWQSAVGDWAWHAIANVGDSLTWRSTHVLETSALNPTCTHMSLDWLYSCAVVDSVRDVPGDQGGHVRLHLTRSGYDFADEVTYPIATYDVWRRVDDPALAQQVQSARPAGSTSAPVVSAREALPIRRVAGRAFVVADPALVAAGFPAGTWEVVGSFAPTQQDQYVFPSETPADSGAVVPWTVYMVTAHTTTPSVWFAGPPDSGYSVDNLPPPMPNSFTAAYVPEATHLHWGPNPAPDFLTFRLHRGAVEAFVPGSENLIAATTDTGFVDAGDPGSWYKITAEDVHGNRSPYAVVGPAGTTAVPGEGEGARFALEPPAPNPASGRTLTVRFALPSAAPAKLELLDVSGRLLEARRVGALGPGPHTLVLGGACGLRPGVYLVRLTQGAQARVRRAVLLE